ncbi:MAG: hypothetical protein JWO36_5392 [Myxococcales bacterium]|nr:hypothetical protein [Myxococcales bacterium]
MGTAKTALLIAAALGAISPRARADSCTGISSSGGRFAACFDLGNRLSVTAGTGGFGGSILLRHDIRFDDEPDLIWKMEHTIAEATHAGFTDRFAGMLYRGRYLRHSRDGHIVLPLGDPPKKVFLPFDVGALVEIGSLRWRPDSAVTLGVMKAAALFDFSRSRDFRRRFALGPVVSWDVEIDRTQRAITDHAVSPFSSLLADLHIESVDGLAVADLRAEAGLVWHTTKGWVPHARAEASVERIIIAVHDRPVALFADVRYESVTRETIAGLGIRIVLLDRVDPRVSLDPPRSAQR